MEASVIISYYKNIPNLSLILQALNRQQVTGKFEVIISEDDNAAETLNFINQHKKGYSFPLVHVSQPDDGFRKCRILNKAIAAASSDLLIFLDGDCIPHKALVQEYVSAKIKGRVMYGRRVMLSEKFSQRLLQTKSLGSIHLLNLILSGCKRVEEGLHLSLLPQSMLEKKSGRLLGCNMGIMKADLLAINGFDEDYTAPGGGEDSDIEWRLEALGTVSFYSMKYKAIVYHIYHKERFSAAMEQYNFKILQDKIQQGFFFCKNGIQKTASAL